MHPAPDRDKNEAASNDEATRAGALPLKRKLCLSFVPINDNGGGDAYVYNVRNARLIDNLIADETSPQFLSF
jgi:hypothetical protein